MTRSNLRKGRIIWVHSTREESHPPPPSHGGEDTVQEVCQFLKLSAVGKQRGAQEVRLGDQTTGSTDKTVPCRIALPAGGQVLKQVSPTIVGEPQGSHSNQGAYILSTRTIVGGKSISFKICFVIVAQLFLNNFKNNA